MHNSELVNVLYAGDDLLEEPGCLLLLQTFSVDDVVEQLPALCILHDEVQLLGGLDDFVELDQVGMPNDFQNVDLPSHSFNVGHVGYFLLFEYFDGHLFACEDVGAFLYLPEGAFPDVIFLGCNGLYFKIFGKEFIKGINFHVEVSIQRFCKIKTVQNRGFLIV